MRRALRRYRAPPASRKTPSRRRPDTARRGRRSGRSPSAAARWYSPTVSRHSSGSSWLAIAVEPTRSQNSTVRWRRSPSGTSCGSPCLTTTGAAASSPDCGTAVGWERSAPQSPQNFLPAGFSAPHFAQRLPSDDPQSPQNRLLSGFSELQLVQRIGSPGKTSDPPLVYHPAPRRDQHAARGRFDPRSNHHQFG